VAAVVTILVLDAVASARQWPLVVQGLLDEPAHLLTAWLS
jgi:inner membrane protein